MLDIARATNLSYTAISLILNNRAGHYFQVRGGRFSAYTDGVIKAGLEPVYIPMRTGAGPPHTKP